MSEEPEELFLIWLADSKPDADTKTSIMSVLSDLQLNKQPNQGHVQDILNFANSDRFFTKLDIADQTYVCNMSILLGGKRES